MKQINLSRFMVDGQRSGTRLKGGTNEVQTTMKGGLLLLTREVKEVRDILRKVAKGRDVEKHELTVKVRGESSEVRVTLRRHRMFHNQWYLNLDGNPLTFFLRGNVYGKANADHQVKRVYTKCMDALEEESGMKFPQRLRGMVEKGQIHINALEFAAYTGKLPDKNKIINAWHYIFHKSTYCDEKGREHFLADMLGFKYMSDGQKDETFSIATARKIDKSPIVMFSAYDKEAEIRKNIKSTGGSDFDVKADTDEMARKYRIAKVPDDIKDRLRLEIAFTSIWFSSKHIRTLADLTERVNKMHGGKWTNLIRSELRAIMEQACLVDMWKFDGRPVLAAYKRGDKFVPEFGPEIPTSAWWAMLVARSTYNMPKEMLLALFEGDTQDLIEHAKFVRNRLVLNPLPEIEQLWPERKERVLLAKAREETKEVV